MCDLVSIIVPVYNTEKYLMECVDSLINQTYTNLEILLIDDGSTDNSGNICDEYSKKDCRVRVIHKENGGVSSARNTGLDLAQGEYISFLDADDVIDKEYVSIMLQKIVETKSDLTFCKYSKFTDESTTVIEEKLPEHVNVDVHDEAFVKFFCRFFDYKQYIFASCNRILFRKSLVYDIRFDQNIKISEDLLFWTCIMLNAKLITSVNQHLYFYRQTTTSVTRSYKKNYLDGQLKLLAELEKKFALFDSEIVHKTFRIHSCLLCYYVLSNELKYKQPTRRSTIQEVRTSKLYKYFTLKNGLRLYGAKSKLKFLITWFLIKARVV